MIKISDPSALVSLVQRLIVKVTSESNSVVECVLLEQINSKLTKLSSIEPGSGFFSRIYIEEDTHSFGDTIGEKYLINCKELLGHVEALSKANSKHLTLRGNEGKLLAYGDLRRNPLADQDEEDFEQLYVSKHCRTVLLYPGALSDFTEPDFEESTYLGELLSSDWELLVATLIQFGSFTGADENYVNTIQSYGRAVRVSFNNQTVQTFTSDKDLMLSQYLEVPISVEEDAQVDETIYIEGRHLYRLTNLAKAGELIQLHLLETKEDNQLWLRVEGSLGSGTVRLKREDDLVARLYTNYKRAKALSESKDPIVKDNPDSPSMLDFKAYINCWAMELSNALTAQHTWTQNTREELILSEDSGVIRIYDVLKAQLEDHSTVDLLDFDKVWTAICIDYKYLLLSLSALFKYSKFRDIDSQLFIYQSPFLSSSESGASVRLMMIFVKSTEVLSNRDFEIFFNARIAEDKLKEEGVNIDE